MPDLVARPADEREVEEVLAWAEAAGAAVVPYGGGTSVVGGVEPRVPARFAGAVSLDLGALDALHEVDPVSRAARIGAGASGPRLEAQLAEHGLTLRFYPQSFELSTLGGWVATRAGGHFATRLTHVDDVVEAVRAITPPGAGRRGACRAAAPGPSPDRMLLGSEGTLGVITEAWVRVQPRPSHRAARDRALPGLRRGAEGVRAVVQAACCPANCGCSTPLEAQATTGAGDGERAVLVLGFESTDHPVDHELERALALCAAHGGVADAPRPEGDGGAAAPAPGARPSCACPTSATCSSASACWPTRSRRRSPGTACPPSTPPSTGATRAALGEPCRVTCRFTHVYPDGPAPYFTVLAPARRGEEVEQWHAMKRAAGDAIIAAGGTITHHHAVGRDHRPWYDRQRPEPFAAALRGAKAAIDPAGILNPGVLVD